MPKMNVALFQVVSLLLLSATLPSCQGQRPEETILQIVQSTTELSEVSLPNLPVYVTMSLSYINIRNHLIFMYRALANVKDVFNHIYNIVRRPSEW